MEHGQIIFNHKKGYKQRSELLYKKFQLALLQQLHQQQDSCLTVRMLRTQVGISDARDLFQWCMTPFFSSLPQEFKHDKFQITQLSIQTEIVSYGYSQGFTVARITPQGESWHKVKFFEDEPLFPAAPTSPAPDLDPNRIQGFGPHGSVRFKINHALGQYLRHDYRSEIVSLANTQRRGPTSTLLKPETTRDICLWPDNVVRTAYQQLAQYFTSIAQKCLPQGELAHLLLPLYQHPVLVRACTEYIEQEERSNLPCDDFMKYYSLQESAIALERVLLDVVDKMNNEQVHLNSLLAQRPASLQHYTPISKWSAADQAVAAGIVQLQNVLLAGIDTAPTAAQELLRSYLPPAHYEIIKPFTTTLRTEMEKGAELKRMHGIIDSFDGPFAPRTLDTVVQVNVGKSQYQSMKIRDLPETSLPKNCKTAEKPSNPWYRLPQYGCVKTKHTNKTYAQQTSELQHWLANAPLNKQLQAALAQTDKANRASALSQQQSAEQFNRTTISVLNDTNLITARREQSAEVLAPTTPLQAEVDIVAPKPTSPVVMPIPPAPQPKPPAAMTSAPTSLSQAEVDAEIDQPGSGAELTDKVQRLPEIKIAPRATEIQSIQKAVKTPPAAMPTSPAAITSAPMSPSQAEVNAEINQAGSGAELSDNVKRLPEIETEPYAAEIQPMPTTVNAPQGSLREQSELDASPEPTQRPAKRLHEFQPMRAPARARFEAEASEPTELLFQAKSPTHSSAISQSFDSPAQARLATMNSTSRHSSATARSHRSAPKATAAEHMPKVEPKRSKTAALFAALSFKKKAV